jgi:hypothetical protein
MLKSFWLNFVLTVAICLGGLSTISSFADIVGEGGNAPIACTNNNNLCANQGFCWMGNGHCLAPPNISNDLCICNAVYAVPPNSCGCGDWFP